MFKTFPTKTFVSVNSDRVYANRKQINTFLKSVFLFTQKLNRIKLYLINIYNFRLNTVIVGSIPSRGMDVCPVLCVLSSIHMTTSPWADLQSNEPHQISKDSYIFL